MRLIEFKNKEDANIANWTYHENVHEQSLKIWFSHIIDSVQGTDHLWQHLYKLIFQVNWKLILFHFLAKVKNKQMLFPFALCIFCQLRINSKCMKAGTIICLGRNVTISSYLLIEYWCRNKTADLGARAPLTWQKTFFVGQIVCYYCHSYENKQIKKPKKPTNLENS